MPMRVRAVQVDMNPINFRIPSVTAFSYQPPVFMHCCSVCRSGNPGSSRVAGREVLVALTDFGLN